MGLFDSIFKPKKTDSAIDAAGVFKALTAYRPVFNTRGGELYESELIRASIDARARHISKLKVEMVGAAQPKLKAKLKHAPNTFQTWAQFLYRLSTILDMQNSAFVVPQLDDNLETIGYFPVLPERCTVVEYKGEPWLRHKFSNGNVGAVEYSKCALLTKFQYKDDFFGETNNALKPTAELMDIQNKGIEEAVKNSASYRFIAQLSNFAKPEDIAKERQRFSEENLKADKGGGILLFPNTYTNVRQIDPTPYTVDAAQMQQIRTNVFDYFGTNEEILQNKAVGDAWSAFYEGAIEPFAIQFSETMTKAIYSEREQTQGSFVIATANRLQYLSNSDKLAISSQLADRGILTRNEIRDIWNLAPLEGGDVPTIRGEYYLIDENGNKIDEKEGGNNAD